jgi:hypothetical protein
MSHHGFSRVADRRQKRRFDGWASQHSDVLWLTVTLRLLKTISSEGLLTPAQGGRRPAAFCTLIPWILAFLPFIEKISYLSKVR